MNHVQGGSFNGQSISFCRLISGLLLFSLVVACGEVPVQTGEQGPQGVPGQNAPVCESDVDCGEGFACADNGQCVDLAADGQDGSGIDRCSSDTDCVGGEYCNSQGVCMLIPEPGVDGQDGADGANGQDGADGVDGQDGQDGQDGADGQDGSGIDLCSSDTDCVGGEYCNSQGVCVLWGAVDPTDTDGDGIPDATDNCPIVANTTQADSDDDGLGDVCDSFADTDRDGIADATDNCPIVANATQADSDDDGLGDVCDPLDDTDRDGIADATDNCPTVANITQVDSDDDGLGDVCDSSPVMPAIRWCYGSPLATWYGQASWPVDASEWHAERDIVLDDEGCAIVYFDGSVSAPYIWVDGTVGTVGLPETDGNGLWFARNRAPSVIELIDGDGNVAYRFHPTAADYVQSFGYCMDVPVGAPCPTR
jgi:hypothetical protein